MTGRGSSRKTGVWIIGALGEIASTLIVGTLAIRNGLASTTGLVTQLPPMDRLDLIPLDNLVFGGQDLRSLSVMDAVEEVYRRSRTFFRETLDAVLPCLASIDDDVIVDTGLAWNVLGPAQDLPPLNEVIARQRKLLRAFADKYALDHVVVVNLASAEPLPAEVREHESLDAFKRLLFEDRKDLVSPSMAYAYAGFMEGCSYINFTSSLGASIDALQELARRRGLPHYGNDGKTGETLVKTVLAPMFLYRNLQVLSWEGINMLGNNDGKTLDDPNNRKAKLKNKADVLNGILGYPVHADVEINYVPSLGDWKTAWDLIHFKGFLDVPMTMQFTWQGCDSILAAPLVLDMVRLSEFAARHGETGPMRHLASFFKNPMDVDEMGFFPQFEVLLDYTNRHITRQQQPVLTVG